MLRDGQFIREQKPVIGRAYQRPLPRQHMTDGSLKYQASVIRQYAKSSEPLSGTLFDAIIGAAALVVFFLALIFIPEIFR